MTEYQTIIVERDGRVGLITLNRPKALNALTLEMVRELAVVLQGWATNPDVLAVLLQGHFLVETEISHALAVELIRLDALDVVGKDLAQLHVAHFVGVASDKPPLAVNSQRINAGAQVLIPRVQKPEAFQTFLELLADNGIARSGYHQIGRAHV